MATYSKGSLRERSKGHWQTCFCRTDRNGSNIVTRSFEATSRRAATLIMEDIRRELIEQDGDGASSRGLIAYMLDYVDERERSQQIEAITATNYRSSIKHLARYLEGYSIEEIAPENVMDVQVALLADGLVVDTVAKDHRFFKQVMDYACEMGHIHRSPFNKATKPPKRRKPRPNALDERSRSMLLSVLDASPTTKQSVAARLGLLAGLRREEVAGLRWGDVDLVANRIRVGRAVGVSNGRPYLKGTKTEAGEREAVLEKGLADTLRSLRSSLGGKRARGPLCPRRRRFVLHARPHHERLHVTRQGDEPHRGCRKASHVPRPPRQVRHAPYLPRGEREDRLLSSRSRKCGHDPQRLYVHRDPVKAEGHGCRHCVPFSSDGFWVCVTGPA